MGIRRAAQTITTEIKTTMGKANEITSTVMARSNGEQNGKTNK